MTNTTTIYHHEDFINNKYYNWYSNIIIKAQSEPRKKGNMVYYERHHIIPKSMGGSNSKDNLVLLTAKEHYICHYLLIKFTKSGGLYKMVHAFRMINIQSINNYSNSRLYESCKETFSKLHSKYLSGNVLSEDTKRKISESHRGSKNYLFKGYYITPYGRYDSRGAAVTNNIGKKSIDNWCKNPDKVISNKSYVQSKYLQSLKESPIGKTFGELGFSFESI